MAHQAVACKYCCLCDAPFVGRGHDPADQVAHFALARFNESAFVSLRFGGVMTPPYEWRVQCDSLQRLHLFDKKEVPGVDTSFA